MIHERRDALCAELARMPLVMEQDVAANPEPVGLFGASAQVAPPAMRGNLIHETRGATAKRSAHSMTVAPDGGKDLNVAQPWRLATSGYTRHE